MYIELIMKKMTELAQGKFTYTPTKEISPAVISDIYNSSPVYFGLMGKVSSSNQDSLLDSPLPMLIDPEKKVYLLIRQNDEAVALISGIVDYPEKDVVFLGWLIVHGQHLFQGIGRSNYQIFCDAVGSLGMKQIHILIEAQNQTAIIFWEGLGFKPKPGFAQKAVVYSTVGIEYYLDLQNGNKLVNPE